MHSFWTDINLTDLPFFGNQDLTKLYGRKVTITWQFNECKWMQIFSVFHSLFSFIPLICVENLVHKSWNVLFTKCIWSNIEICWALGMPITVYQEQLFLFASSVAESVRFWSAPGSWSGDRFIKIFKHFSKICFTP